MIAVASQWLTAGLGLWLAGLGVFMGVAPRAALQALARMGGSPAIHFGEMALRIAAGVALVLAASESRCPVALAVIGWFLIVSAVVLMALPRRWHAAYSTWWAARIPVAAVRVVAPISVVIGGVLVWVVL